jgi:hypothetical protein
MNAMDKEKLKLGRSQVILVMELNDCSRVCVTNGGWNRYGAVAFVHDGYDARYPLLRSTWNPPDASDRKDKALNGKESYWMPTHK